MKDVRFINVPMYDELSVKHFLPEFRDLTGFMVYFPDKLPKGRLPNREYFFNVMNTVNSAYVVKLVRHANELRHSIQSEKNAVQAIEITEGWMQKLNE